MKIIYAIKYEIKNKKTKISIDPFFINDILRLFNSDFEFRIDDMYIYEYFDDSSKDKEHTEKDFKKDNINIKYFLNFLESLNEYRIYRMEFESIKYNISFYIDEEHVSIMSNESDLKYLLFEIIKILKLPEPEKCINEIFKYKSQYVCFSSSNIPVFISKSFLDVCEFTSAQYN